MRVEYDERADAIYIRLRDAPYAYGKVLDDDRNIDYDADHAPIGVELLNVSLGVNPDDLPERDAIVRALDDHHIKVFASNNPSS